MSHPGAISNHFDAMHNLLSGQSERRVQNGQPNDQPYMGSFVAKHKPSTRNFVSNAWLIKCVGPPVFCAPNIGIGGYLGSAYAPVFVGSAKNHPAWKTSNRRRSTTRTTRTGSKSASRCWRARNRPAWTRTSKGKDWSDLREKTYDALTRQEGREAFDLDREPQSVRDRYGMHPIGQNLLLARRMVGNGRPFRDGQRLDRTGRSRQEGPPSSSWDMHGGNMGMGNAFGTGPLRHGLLPAPTRPGALRAALGSQ
ncbi:MAG: hypothetical protein Ct9H300mP1_06470 [Planctomycetaceae bacterium]|nr:MAG: hypothetical protein Ct9H300mP1_06470 [Planctomycetaceae bacterium]